MPGEQLLSLVDTYLPLERARFVKGSLKFAEAAHRGQRRMSGEPYIEHPIATATLLAELKMDATTIAAALMHDVVEDCGIELETLKDEFGYDVARLVDGVTKLKGIDKITGITPTAPDEARAASHPQDARSDVRGHPRRDDQIGRQAPQHAYVVAPAASPAGAHSPGNPRHLRATGAPARHVGHQVAA